MRCTLEYKGYSAPVDFEEEDRVYHGRVGGIEDVISFEGETLDEAAADFRRAVDDYEAFRLEQGLAPETNGSTLALRGAVR